MTTPEKCRMLLELAKKADQKDVSFSEVMKAQVVFEKSANTTTVAEICEAYLKLEFGQATDLLTLEQLNKCADSALIKTLNVRIQELEADLRHREELSEDLSFIEADTYGKNKDLMAALGQAVDQLKEDYKTSPLDGHGALIRKLEEALAKARKVGG